MQKHISGLVIALLLISIFSSVFSIHLVKAAETVYIKADGSVVPSSAPILSVDNVSYTFTDNINDSIVVERDNIVVDGAGHTLEGNGSGIGIYLTFRGNVTIKNITIEAFEYGISLSNSSSNTLSANRIINNTYGIWLLDYSSSNIIYANNITNSNYSAIQISSSPYNSVSANNVTNNGYGILLEYSSNNNSISANSITNNKDYGVKLYSHSNNNSISANNITNSNGFGILLYSTSSNNSISANYIANNTVYGIKLYSASSNSIYSNNIINNNGKGIWLFSEPGSSPSNNNSISANNITNSTDGIWLEYASSNGIYSNNVTNNKDYGIDLYSSSDNVISANNIANNFHGIELWSSSNNNSISANNITNNTYYGMQLLSSSYNRVSENNVTNNSNEGISLDSSSNNSISANNIANNSYGISLTSSSNNSISSNNITNNNYDIELYSSSYNRISANYIANSNRGIYLYDSESNLIFHNNFMDNAAQAIVDPLGRVNTWDDGYPSGGNVWSNYTGVDFFSGPYQNVTGSDGIGDAYHVIDANNTDRYPLMSEWSPVFTLESVTAWYWTNNTVVNSVAVGDVDGDGQKETVTGGTFHDGSRDVAQLVVWNSSSLMPERLTTWYWTDNTAINSVAIGDVDGDGGVEIVTGGYYFDGTRKVAQLVVWNGSDLSVDRLTTWYWTNNTVINSVAVGNVDGDGQTEIVTGGYYNDGTRNNAQLVVWTGSTLAVDRLTTWYWTNNTVINSVAIGDVDADAQVEIVTGGYFNDDTRNIAQLVVWNGTDLSVDRLTTWYWTNNTVINSVAIGDVDADGQIEIITGGTFFDGTRDIAQLVVWTGSSLAVDRLTTWYWTGDTVINSVALGDMDGDSQVEIVTGGYYNDGARDVAQMVSWSGSSLAVKNIQTWYWFNDTHINSVCLSDINTDLSAEIVTGGAYHDGLRWNAQLTVWGMR